MHYTPICARQEPCRSNHVAGVTKQVLTREHNAHVTREQQARKDSRTNFAIRANMIGKRVDESLGPNLMVFERPELV